MSPEFSDREGFVHRENRDRTFDSFCRACLRTVGTARLEADLEDFERRHVCDPHEVERFKRPGRDEDEEEFQTRSSVA